jgi:hypothetical protein
MNPARRRLTVILTAAIALLLVSGTMVAANHNFSDVPTSAYYHSSVDWGVDRGLIAGCGNGKFCPNSALTRGQGITIMNALANVVSPQTLTAEVFEVVNQDLDAAPVVCQTSTWRRPYTETVFGIARTSVAPDITNLSFVARVVYQRNGGAWTLMPPSKATASGAAAVNEDTENVSFGVLNLDANATYKFGIRIELIGHTPTPGTKDGNYECALMMQIFNRN